MHATEKATMGLLSTLLEWNKLDPPSSSEALRNARVCSLYQGNRNPFVDHPEYAATIWGAPAGAQPTIPAGPGNGNQLPNAWINELHYTNKSKDEGEVWYTHAPHKIWLCLHTPFCKALDQPTKYRSSL